MANTSPLKIASIIAAITLASCAKPASPSSNRGSVKGITANSNGGNVAVLLETNFQFASTDVRNLKTLLSDPTGNYGFIDIKTNDNTNQYQITQFVKEAAPKVGDDGTLVLYLGGHGSPNGYLQTFDNQFVNFSTIQKAIKQSRTKPFRRLVLFIFSCYSGNWVDQTQGVMDQLAKQTTNDAVNGLSSNDNPYKELLVVTSSSKYVESWSQGAGTAYGNAIMSAYKTNKNNNSFKMRQFLQEVVTKGTTIQPQDGPAIPQFRAVPESMLEETMTNNGTVTTPQPTSSGIAVALTDGTGAAASGFVAAADSKVVAIKMCQSTFDQCQNSTQKIDLRASTIKVTGRNVFDTAGQTYTLVHDSVTTFLGYDANNNLISHQQIRIRQKGN